MADIYRHTSLRDTQNEVVVNIVESETDFAFPAELPVRCGAKAYLGLSSRLE